MKVMDTAEQPNSLNKYAEQSEQSEMVAYYYSRLELTESEWERSAILTLINLCQWKID